MDLQTILSDLMGPEGITLLLALGYLCAWVSALIPQEMQEKYWILRLIDKIGANVGEAKTGAK